MKKQPEKSENTLLFPVGDLSLQEHLDLLGIDAGLLNFYSQVPAPVINRALQGGHITLPHAQAICRALSSQHGAATAHATGIQPEHIRGLQVWKLDEKHHQPIPDSGNIHRQ